MSTGHWAPDEVEVRLLGPSARGQGSQRDATNKVTMPVPQPLDVLAD